MLNPSADNKRPVARRTLRSSSITATTSGFVGMNKWSGTWPQGLDARRGGKPECCLGLKFQLGGFIRAGSYACLVILCQSVDGVGQPQPATIEREDRE